MNAKELRIGNLIKANKLYEGKELIVEEIHSLVVFFEDNHAGEYINDCIGVPLTEDWLVRFGFEKFSNAFYLLIGYTRLEYWISSKEMCIGDLEITIEYVHQLQNLYFALTGSELEINSYI